MEPAPVVTWDSYGGGRYDPDPGSNFGIAIGYLQLSEAFSGWCVGVLYRAEYRAEASKDLLDVLVSNHFSHPFDPGRTYNILMSEHAFKAGGARAGRTFALPLGDDWTLSGAGAVSLLKGFQAQEQQAQGEITATSATYATGSAAWLRDQSNLGASSFNPFVAPGTPEAWGYSTDLEVIAESKAGWLADLTVIDLYGRLYWRELPQTFQTLQNATVTYNQDLDRNAAIVGFDSRVDLTQVLTPKYHVFMESAPLVRFSAFVEDDYVSALNFPSFGARYGSAASFGSLDFDTRTHAVGLQLHRSAIQFGVSSNKFAVRQATVLGAYLRLLKSW
jgi:hypothetical protein